MVKAKRPPKTIKEKKFVKEYLKTGNATEAAAKVYDVSTRDVARNIGSQNVAKLSIEDELDKAGLTDGKIANTLNEATEAQKIVSSYNTNKESNAGTDDFIEIPDWQARLKAIELASKIKGHLKDRLEHNGNITLNTLIQINENHQPITVADPGSQGQNEV